jgi:hypothetical protein
VNRAGTALSDAAAVLGAFEIENVAENPQQRHVRGRVNGFRGSIDVESVRHYVLSVTREELTPVYNRAIAGAARC